MPRPKLLAKEQVFEVLGQWFAHNSVPPTIEELRRLLHVGSTRTVLRYLDELNKEGYIERWSGSRGLKMLRSPKARGVQTRLIPIFGEAPAGTPLPAEENIRGHVQLPKEFLRPANGKFFLLRVRGDSMNRAKVQGHTIEDEDLVLVRQQERAESSQIIVALIDGEATIKRLVKASNYYILQPESTNQKHLPIVMAQDFQIQGVVCRVLKRGTLLLT